MRSSTPVRRDYRAVVLRAPQFDRSPHGDPEPIGRARRVRCALEMVCTAEERADFVFPDFRVGRHDSRDGMTTHGETNWASAVAQTLARSAVEVRHDVAEVIDPD